MGVQIVNWFAAIFGFGFLILIHEFGHFLALRISGLPVHSFSVGFGVPIWRKKCGKTIFRVGWLPLGGYVMSEDPGEIERREEAGENLFPDYSPVKNLFVAVLGPLANLFFAFLLFFVVIFFWGTPSPVPVAKSVVPLSPAAQAGIVPGDEILSINLETVKTWDQLIGRIQVNQGKPCRIRLGNKNGEREISLVPALEGSRFVIGVRPDYAAIPVGGCFDGLSGAVYFTINQLLGVFHGLAEMFTSSGLKQVSGPIAILSMASISAQGGIMSFFLFMGILSVNLGVFNLLPIPPLDGIRILMALWHGIIGRPLREKIVLPVFQWGTAALLISFAIVTLKDLWFFASNS